MASSLVYLLGGNPYSNTLYGKDAQGQLIMFRTQEMSYTILSNKMLDKEKNLREGFVAARSYNRSDLLTGSLKGEFVILGKSYASKYIVFLY